MNDQKYVRTPIQTLGIVLLLFSFMLTSCDNTIKNSTDTNIVTTKATIPPVALTIDTTSDATTTNLVVSWKAGTLGAKYLSKTGATLTAAELQYKVYYVKKGTGAKDATAIKKEAKASKQVIDAKTKTFITITDLKPDTDYKIVIETINSTDTTKIILSAILRLKTTQIGKHLFILSGQSNMVGVRPQDSFTPTVVSEFGKENVIVVKKAFGGYPIRRWYRDWKPLVGDTPKANPDSYNILMTKVDKSIKNKQIKTITFVWMQGERDAREKFGEVYEDSLIGLYNQLSKDMKRYDINFVIGRLSDYDLNNAQYPHWTMIRDVQVKLAESNDRFAWIDTDDLNDGLNKIGQTIKNDLHMSATGYTTMGTRFANNSIQIIKKNE